MKRPMKAFNEKTNIFGLSFLLFFYRLQIYEAIAAIFWQSASYVYWFAANLWTRFSFMAVQTIPDSST